MKTRNDFIDALCSFSEDQIFLILKNYTVQDKIRDLTKEELLQLKLALPAGFRHIVHYIHYGFIVGEKTITRSKEDGEEDDKHRA